LPKSYEKEDGGNGDQLDLEVATFASRLGVPMTKPFSFRWPPDKGLPLDPSGGSAPDPRYKLMLRTRHSCPPHIFTPGDAPGCAVVGCLSSSLRQSDRCNLEFWVTLAF